MSTYGNAYAAGAIAVIARLFGFDDVADAALDAQRDEIDRNYGCALDEEKLGTCGVAERLEWAISDTTPALIHAVSVLAAEVETEQRRQAMEDARAAGVAALAKLRDDLRATTEGNEA